MTESIEPTDCQTGGAVACAPAGGRELPTRQKNALRHLLDQPEVSPADVARLGYRALERAPGVGRQSIEIILAWLRAHGYELVGQPTPVSNPRALQRKRKLERAISYLRERGYDVRPNE
jgi:CTP:molybdopterin cytidylyltransferase MocA